MFYTRATAATDATVHAYRNGNLANPGGWSQSGVTETMLSDDGTTQQWKATVPATPGSPLYMRLQITRP
jgi:hypothetical protein